VVRNLRHLVTLQQQRGCQTPRVSMWFTAMQTNLEELPAFVRLAAEVGVAEVYTQRLVFYGKGLAVQEQSLHRGLNERQQQLIAAAEAIATGAGIAFQASGATTPMESLNAPTEARHWAGCQRPWTLSYVTANGNVLPCCISPWTTTSYRGLILGNIFHEGLADIWNGTKYQQFRRDFESDSPPDPCRGCGLLWSI